MDGMPILKGRMLGIVGHNALFKTRNPSIIYNNIQTTFFSNNLSTNLLPIGFFSHIKMAIVSGCSNRADHLFAQRIIEVCDKYKSTFVRKRSGDRLANAPSSSRDQSNFSL